MAERYDAAARLAQGQPSVDDLQNFVSASRTLGYQHPDLTVHSGQLRDWYATEDGLDLRALDSDCAALHAAATVAENALAGQDKLLADLATAWRGGGAEAARMFLRRHGEASARATASVRNAAVALADLRDNLWRAVDEKVAAVHSIDDRVHTQRADWLAAAHTVTTGAGDLPAASELIDRQVTPFVDNDVRTELVTALRAAIAAVTAAYDAASAELGSTTSADFDAPDDLGPTGEPFRGDVQSAPAPAAWAAPASAPPVAPAAAPIPPAAAPVPPAADPAATSPAMSAPSIPSLGGGMPDVGSGLSGLGRQLGEMIAGLTGTTGESLSSDLGGPDLEEADRIDEDDEDDGPDDDGPDDDESDDERDDDSETVDAEKSDATTDPPCEPPPEDPPPDEPPAETAAGTEAPVDAPPAAVEPPSPNLSPPPPPEPAAVPRTPCEIAADELPQVGE
jgi:hypothetical protein